MTSVQVVLAVYLAFLRSICGKDVARVLLMQQLWYKARLFFGLWSKKRLTYRHTHAVTQHLGA